MDTELTLGPLQAVIAAVLFVLVVWIVLKLLGLLVAVLRFLNGDETAISRYFDRNRERKGFEALADGLLALASGEGARRDGKAPRGRTLPARPELTNLLTAQAAEMTGDRAKAEEVYKRLLTDDRTRFVGVRGLMRQKLAEGDTDTALKLAEKAFALKPRHEETQDVLLQLQAERHDWTGARKTLAAKLKHGALPRDVHRRRDAVLALAEARTCWTRASASRPARQRSRPTACRPTSCPPRRWPPAPTSSRASRAMPTRVHQQGLGGAAAPRPRRRLRRDRAGRDAEERIKRFQALTRQIPTTRRRGCCWPS